MPLLYFIQQLINAVQISALYALLAAAFVLLYGVANRINLAFGSLAMWSAYVTITLITLLLALTSWPLLVVIFVGGAIAVVNTSTVGFVLHKTVISPLIRQRSQAMLIATVGVAIILEETMRLISGSKEIWLAPVFVTPIPLVTSDIFPIQVTTIQLVVTLIALATVIGQISLMKRHRFGRLWRACSEDLKMAALCGINIQLILTSSFVLAAFYAALSGTLISLLYGSASFGMGLMIGLKTLFVAVIGGMKSVGGCLIAAFLLGFFETFWSAYFAIEYRDVASLMALTFLLVLNQDGVRLFGSAFSINRKNDHYN
ncbi:branched-chain amino acid ABC transporter permease [Sneathiella marina]|uniref:Branched-chain amino acid ABC transporter permease n=1 Tax=Sneathiella marina TaxID=2950108 RepID=A0ABY4W5F7_9PROT|nr:branched-chain amino acid ABC transporter permease [Sneathiella marina]USG61343.1 branched-chain amino acid ABC transporter permease [Sneathiella marina]